MIDGDEAQALEPALACTAAMLSPQTGIIDSHGLMLALQGEIEDHGGAIAFNTPVERLEHKRRRLGGRISAAPSRAAWRSTPWSTRAGHGAQRLARATDGYPAERVPRLVLAKGNYFAYTGRPAFQPPDLSGAARLRRPRRARDARSRRPHALRPRRRMA